MTQKNIPTNEDFARASMALKKRSRGLSQVRDKILERFRGEDGLYEFFILDCSQESFRAYVFYRWDRQIEECELSGLSAKIINAVFDELERIGRGKRSEVEVYFEFDSHEAVEQSYDGNYYNRLH